LPSHTSFCSSAPVSAAVPGKEETRFQNIHLSLSSEVLLPWGEMEKNKKDQVSCTAFLLLSIYQKDILNAKNYLFSNRNS